MEAALNGIRLRYEERGSGDAVVFIHGAFIADSFSPLLREPALSHYRLITYSRRGYAGSTRGEDSPTIQTQAADCGALLAHLGIERAHVVGHSLGGVIALQLAVQSPEVVRTLALLEPALMLGQSATAYRESLLRGQQRYQEAGATVAVDEFLEARWPGYRSSLDATVPGAFEQAVADADTCFEFELPGWLNWRFGQSEAQGIHKPALAVVGEESLKLWDRFGETQRFLLAFLPQVEELILPGATHFLQFQNPSDMAEALAGFYSRRG